MVVEAQVTFNKADKNTVLQSFSNTGNTFFSPHPFMKVKKNVEITAQSAINTHTVNEKTIYLPTKIEVRDIFTLPIIRMVFLENSET